MDKDFQEGRLIEQDIVDALSDIIDSAIASGDWSKLPFQPKKNCKHCYGKRSQVVMLVNRKTNERFTKEQYCQCVLSSVDEYLSQHSIYEIIPKKEVVV
jgi:hypothetical protein